MQEFSEKISYLASKGSAAYEKYFLYPETKFFSHKPSFLQRLVQKIIKVREGVVIKFPNTEQSGIRMLLENLKSDNFLLHYGEGPIFSDYPKFHYIGLNYTIDQKHAPETQLSWGYCLPGEDIEVAYSKALGESVERQASYYLPKTTYAKFPRQQFGDSSFLFDLIPSFTKRQLSSMKQIVTASDDLKNVRGFYSTSLTGDTSRFLPFESFYWGSISHDKQKLFYHHTSSGSGGGSTKTQATLSAWYELIERDHLLLYWFSGVQPEIIDNNTLPEGLRSYVENCESRYKLEVYFLNLKHDSGLMVAACVVIDPILNKIAMGAKAGANDGTSVLKGSLLEALAVLSSTRSRDKGATEDELEEVLARTPFSEPISRSGRVNLYASPSGIRLVRETFLSGDHIPYKHFVANISPFDTQEKELQGIQETFKGLVKEKGAGYHAYLHEFSSVWLDKLKYHAVHIFIPSLLKLHLNETLATPVSPRLYEFAESRGKKIDSENEINGLPHFFP